MLGSFRTPTSRPSRREQRREGEWLSPSLSPGYFIPGLIVGFLCGFILDFRKLPKTSPKSKGNVNNNHPSLAKHREKVQRLGSSAGSNDELKMVLVVRQDLKMGVGKIASQCAHAATGIYAELILSQRSLLRQWESSGQPKIALSCKNQQEMDKLKEAADSIGLPTFVVADAGRTQVSAGSRTVLAIGPGGKASVDSVTGRLRLL
ncbi:hypothetical protein Sjap_011485 [Stephania japonica]|uniref:peptidyl-tRNA hydrolase n=1 Tax=Stephania japonica TaxID=461633 RepID=A0AAP0JDK3_9MAGN